VSEILSLWRFPLDQVALSTAKSLARQQPSCSIGFGEDFSAMTIFNYGYYLSQAGASPDSALTAMFAAMSPGPFAAGGLAFIPQQYPGQVHSSVAGFAVPDQCNIIGSGGGGSAGKDETPFYHFQINYSDGPTFLSCTGGYTTGGKYFRSLAFFGTSATSANDTCIYAGTGNCRAVNCTFTDIPTAFNAQGDGCALEQCTIYYHGISGTETAPVKAVIIAGAQCAVLGPGEFLQPGGGSPAYCTAVSIEGAAHAVIANIHLSDWNIGVDFSQSPGAQDTQIRSCELQSWQSALNIQLPAGPITQTTSGVKATGCLLAKQSDTTTTNPVVLIDPQLSTGNDNSQLSDVTLLDCTVINYAPSSSAIQHGLEIAGGTNIKIIGGTYSNNGGAGIAITGPCGEVQIIGASFEPTYFWAPNLNNQSYGLLVSGNPTGTVYVSDCDLSGYTGPGQQAVEVTGTPQELLIYNCPGYNDQNMGLNGGAAPTSSINAATCSTPYYGPSVFVFSNSTAVSLYVFGQTITASFGIIFLPSPYDSFYFSVAPSTFSWLGK
jgi:hypothetical protein